MYCLFTFILIMICIQAKEVYLHNPWLTYGIGLHRIREAGLGTDLMDGIDEGPLSIDEVWQWCVDFFIDGDDNRLRHPSKDWDGFIENLEGLLKQEKLVWNPVKNKLYPWINVGMLKSI